MPPTPLRLASREAAARREFRPLASLQSLHVDIAAGVLAAAAFAASATGARPPRTWWIALPAAAWVVYSLDRMLDVRVIPGPARAARRRFYQVHRNALAALTAAVAVVALVAGFALPTVLLAPGLGIAALAVGHLALARRQSPLPKEASAASIYVAGVWYAPLILAGGADVWTWTLLGLHLAAALGNLGAFSLIEEPSDTADAQPSSVHRFGPAPVRGAVVALAGLGTVAAAALFAAGPSRIAPHGAVLLLLLWLPVVLDASRAKLAPTEHHRLADLAFLLLALPAVV